MTLAILTTVYPAAEPFLADFVTSLATQTDSDFTLYVGNDGLDRADQHFLPLGKRVRQVSVRGTIAEIRQQLIRRIAADGHDLVVFADSDDRFSPERIAVARSGLRIHDIVVNELVPFGARTSLSHGLLRPLLKPGGLITWRDVLDHNVFGLSNTSALTSVVLRHSDHIGTDIQAFDWALFTRALFFGANATFTEQAITFYRQHGTNIGLTGERDVQALERAVRMKARHYHDLRALDAAFATRAIAFSRLVTDSAAFHRYANDIASQPPATGLWWSAARLPKESEHAAL